MASAYSYFTALLVFLLSFVINSSTSPGLSPYSKELCDSVSVRDEEFCTERLIGIDCPNKKCMLKIKVKDTYRQTEVAIKQAKQLVVVKKMTHSVNTEAAEECVEILKEMSKNINDTNEFVENERFEWVDEKFKNCYGKLNKCLVSYKVGKNPLEAAIKLLLRAMNMVNIVVAHSKKE